MVPPQARPASVPGNQTFKNSYPDGICRTGPKAECWEVAVVVWDFAQYSKDLDVTGHIVSEPAAGGLGATVCNLGGCLGPSNWLEVGPGPELSL